jgi:hypothetical protein
MWQAVFCSGYTEKGKNTHFPPCVENRLALAVKQQKYCQETARVGVLVAPLLN